MPPKATQKSYIPLVCSLCPKTPKFSDVSHLLTHISSKAHLAHRFNLQISSQADEEVANQLEAYDMWFVNYGIAGLLQDRMTTKENKKNGVTKQKTSTTQFKTEIKTENINPALYNYPAGQVYRPPVPLMQPSMNHWQGYNNPLHGNRMRTPAPASEWGEDSPYDTPTMSNNVPNFNAGLQAPKRKAAVAAVEGITQKSAYNSDVGETDEEEEDPHAVAPASQLKGVIWPGMDMFDAATADAKRRRNQKKDASILELMKITSRTTEPIEVILNHDLSFRRSRSIFENNDSEDEGLDLTEAPTPVKRRGRTRNALKKVDGNVPRLRKPSAMVESKKAVRGRANNTFEDGKFGSLTLRNQAYMPPLSRSNSSITSPSTRTSRYEPSIDEEDDFPSFRDPVKRSNIRVFRDVRAAVEKPSIDEEDDFPSFRDPVKRAKTEVVRDGHSPAFGDRLHAIVGNTPYVRGLRPAVEQPSIDEEDGQLRYPFPKPKIRVFRGVRAAVEMIEGDRYADVEGNSPARTESPLEEARFEDFHSYHYQPGLNDGHQPPLFYRLGMRDAIEEGPNPLEQVLRDQAAEKTLYAQQHPEEQFIPPYGFFHAPQTINPLRAQLQDPHPRQSRLEAQGYAHSFNVAPSSYAGDFRPVNAGRQYSQAPRPSYTNGGSGSRSTPNGQQDF